MLFNSRELMIIEVTDVAWVSTMEPVEIQVEELVQLLASVEA